MGKFFRIVDWVAVVLLLVIVLLGLFLLVTIDKNLFAQQLLFVLVGLLLFVLFSVIDESVLWWAGPYVYVCGSLFLLLPYFGPSIRGATRWVFIAGMQFQPSELVKPLFLLAFARFIAQYPPRTIKYIPLHVLFFVIPFFLIFRQPDLGTSIVYACFWLAMMLAGGMPVGVFVSTLVGCSIVSPLIWHVLASYQRARILTFLNPSLDPRGAGYNAIQSMIAVGSGQFFGRGLGKGTQSHLRFLPEFHTDFVFAALIEELGFIGGIVLFAGYGLLLWRILTPLVRGMVDDLFSFTYSVGLFTTVLSQVVIHAGMNMGIFPVTGITLPFVSYGGSSLLSLSMSFGLLWALQLGRSDRGSIAIR